MASSSTTPSTSSATKLWATASKEWVIQPKPRPGRKPKKDSAPLKLKQQLDPKGRRVQNRAAQRAFRERKQSQLAELQARIQSYEQGEIERNVALQNIAKRLKEENEKLRQENLTLHARVAQIENEQKQVIPLDTDKKRWRDDSPSISMALQAPARKKSRSNSSSDHSQLPAFSVTHLPSPSSMVSTPDSNHDAEDPHFSSLPYEPQPELDTTHFGNLGDLESSMKAANATMHSFPEFGCGFCDEGTLCVCREIASQHVASNSITDFKSAGFEQSHLLPSHENTPGITSLEACDTTATVSILDNLPAYHPPVPLRRRPGKALINSVFPVNVAPSYEPSRITDATCSGDPSNCLACADDSFGKAFCAAIEDSASRSACDSHYDSQNSRPEGSCYKNGSACNNCPGSSSSIESSSSPSSSTELMPTNDAWQKLKAHPNVEFADLSLLAEVVASRSKCSGPRLVISHSPEPHHPTSRRSIGENRSGGSSPPPRLVPQEVLLECGRRNMRHVHADGVFEALRILDAKFS
ncbi:hypothetical protein B0H34DRAFT_792656 [Crassisporium funariophilum]|nr:hypothetical protein B0H34DRAFT_792656 [Crassisporium funariophilum]